MATRYSSQIVQNGLVLYLDAANFKSYITGSTWYDLSRNNNATKGGSQSPAYPQYNSNGWFTFTGGITGTSYSNFYVTTPTMNAITVIVWHYPTQTGGHVLRHTQDSFQIGADGYAAGTAYNNINCSREDTTLNVWKCDALTFTGTNLTGYRNGAVYSTASRASTTIAGGQLNIGTRNDAYAAHYVGNIAMIAIYNRALSSAEILQNYNATRRRFGL
jgi:hypothetical protein